MSDSSAVQSNMEGYLVKRPDKGLVKKWKKRWCVAINGYAYLQTKPNQTKPIQTKPIQTKPNQSDQINQMKPKAINPPKPPSPT